MTDKFVDLEALNLRSAPDASTLANRIGILHLGQPVKEIGPVSPVGPVSAERWVEIDAELNGATKRGVVKAEIDGLPSLREPVSAAREVLVAEALKEWLRFKKGQGLEHHDPFFKFVGQMWQAIGLNLDGKDRDAFWSAAAISFMVRHAGAAFGGRGILSRLETEPPLGAAPCLLPLAAPLLTPTAEGVRSWSPLLM